MKRQSLHRDDAWSGAPPAGRVAVLGAGPVGLDVALACIDAGRPVTVYEAGGAVAANVGAWGHVRMFTPWEVNLSDRMRTHLARSAHRSPPSGDTPTGDELAAILRAVADLPGLTGRIRLGTRVVGIARCGLLKHEQIATAARAAAQFRVLVEDRDGERVEHADVVFDCTGTFGFANTIGDGGIPAPGERALAQRIMRVTPAPGDAHRWAGTVLLVGAGKSAQTAARELAALPDTRIEWIVRDPDPDWGAVPEDPLPGRRQLVDTSRALAAGASDRVTVRTGTCVEALQPLGEQVEAALRTVGRVEHIVVDHILGLTGYVGDASLYRQLQVHECYATAAPMNLSAALLGAAAGGDCLIQPAVGPDVLRNPEPNFFILGAKSYGRLNTFLLRRGYEQVDQLMGASGSRAAGGTRLATGGREAT